MHGVIQTVLFNLLTPPSALPHTGEDSVLPSELKAIAEERTGGREV